MVIITEFDWPSVSSSSLTWINRGFLLSIQNTRKLPLTIEVSVALQTIAVSVAFVSEREKQFRFAKTVQYGATATVINRCILEDRRRQKLQHLRWGGEFVLRTPCDTRASVWFKVFFCFLFFYFDSGIPSLSVIPESYLVICNFINPESVWTLFY